MTTETDELAQLRALLFGASSEDTTDPPDIEAADPHGIRALFHPKPTEEN